MAFEVMYLTYLLGQVGNHYVKADLTQALQVPRDVGESALARVEGNAIVAV